VTLKHPRQLFSNKKDATFPSLMHELTLMKGDNYSKVAAGSRPKATEDDSNK
jgi:hypothetical protein